MNYSFLKKQSSFIKEVGIALQQKRNYQRNALSIGSFKEDELLHVEWRNFRCCDRLRKIKFLAKSFILNEKKNYSLFIPTGFAHGYQSITDNTVVLYFMSKEYAPNYSDGINPLSNILNIKWPIRKKIISIKDKNLPHLKSEFKGL